MSKKKISKDTFEFPFDLEKAFIPGYFKKALNWQQEIVSFYARRFILYSEIREKLADCRSTHDVFELQSQFLSKMYFDYVSEAAVISEMLFDMAQPAIEKSQKTTETGPKETILKAEKDAEKIIKLAKNQAETIIEAAEARADSLIKGKKRPSKAA